jgi:hypothetical protein
MVNAALLETVELLTPDEQNAILAVAEFLKTHREVGAARRFMRENPTWVRLLAQ